VSPARLRYGCAAVPRRLPLLPLPLLLLAGVCMAQTGLVGTPPAVAMGAAIESPTPVNDQGSNSNYRSNITAVTPGVPGLSVQVLEFADRLVLTNRTGTTVTVYGYDGEPYARVLADGTVERNARSPATYLNASFYGDVNVPAIANDPTAPPEWEVLDRTGQFEWHDHRIHYTSPALPPEVKDRSKRTLIFDWKVPIEVGASRGAIAGQLFWTPESSKAPLAAIILGAAIVLGGLAFVVFVRRRRARGAPAGGGESGTADGLGGSPKEAW
jgi:hypothetical protein